MSVSERDILAAMSKVMDPELHIDLVKAGMVKDIRVSGDSVKLKIELTTPACPLKGKIQADAEAALKGPVKVAASEALFPIGEERAVRLVLEEGEYRVAALE